MSVENENALYNFTVATGALILTPKWCVCVSGVVDFDDPILVPNVPNSCSFSVH